MTDYQEGSVTFSIGVEDSDAARKLDDLGERADSTNGKLDDTEVKQDSVRIKSIQTMTALQRVVSGLSATTSGLSATTSAMDTLQIGSEGLRTSIKQVEDSDAARKLDDLGGKADSTNGKLDELGGRADSTNSKLGKLGERADETNGKLGELGGKADSTNSKLDDTQAKQDSIRLKSIQTMTALQGVVSGLSATTSAMDTLQIGSEGLRTSIRQVAAAIQLFVGIAQTIKGAVTLIETLNTALKMTAVMSTFAWAAANPAASLLVVGAVGAAGGYVISQITNVSNTTTYNSSTQDTRQASSVLNAAAWYA